MPSIPKTIALIAAGTMLVAAPAVAQGYHHHRRHHRYAAAQPDGSGEPYGYRNLPYPQFYGGYYGGGGWEAATNARLTAQAYREPGVTLELAPDSKQSATGGPSGGVPGFSGH